LHNAPNLKAPFLLLVSRIMQQQRHPGVIAFGSAPTPCPPSQKCRVRRRPPHRRHHGPTSTSAALDRRIRAASRSISRTGCGVQ
jgi:hypothetical protein